MAWRGRKDVHSGTLCRDTTRGDGGRVEPPGSGEALWRSPEHDHEAAPVLVYSGLSWARAASIEEAWSVHGVDRQGPGRRPRRSQEATPHGASDFRAVAGRGRILRRLHDCARICGAGHAARPRDVRAVEPSPGSRAGGFWRGGWLYRGQEGAVSLFLRGPAALGWLLRQGLSDRDGRSFLRWPCGGVRFFRRRATVILYDNTRLAVARIVKGGQRLRSQMFAELQSHYLFDDRFGRPGKGNDKGKVEGLVGYVRRNFMTPLPVADSFDALNARFLDACVKRRQAVLRGQATTIAERMRADTSAFMPLPPAPYDACHKVATRVSSLSLVRYKNNDYSVPTRYGHQEVLAKGYVDRVEIACRGETIAVHARSYETADFVYNPLHYLALLEHKSRALDQAAPLDDWRLAECMHRLRRLMEARMGNPGRREFIQVLRLMEDFHQHQVEQAVAEALRLGAISFDAVKMLLLARLEKPPARLRLAVSPYPARA